MNLIDAVVTKVKSKPEFKYDKWWVTVDAVDMGGVSESMLMFSSEKVAANITIGHEFQR